MTDLTDIMRRRLRHNLSRSVWLARLLRLPVSEGASSRPGLVMIQIDGLGQSQFEHALERGELPFLRRLIKRKNYRVHLHYSGLPATTPAVQGELFYGVKAAVPAFSFRDLDSQRIVRMYDPDIAAQVEERLESQSNRPLLENGSAYADNYTGGAAEPHFCPSSIGWGPALRAANPFVVLTFLLGNFYSFVRVAVLLGMEAVLALADFCRGMIRGQDFFKELKFIPSRVAVSILLRELCVIGGKIDVSRGLPIIHINFLGYDEQSHRRGPSSFFAHWTLKGIDDSIARLWRAAHRSPARQYDIWIYSDHGQAATRPYHQLMGYPLADAVNATFEKMSIMTSPDLFNNARGAETQRSRLLGGDKIQRLFAALNKKKPGKDEFHPSLASLGPVGHVYPPRMLSKEEQDFVGKELTQTHSIPVVLHLEASGVLRAWTADSEFTLPRDCPELFGAQHPFIDALGEDLVRLCEHCDAGHFVLLGWREGVAPLTFAEENGAHAGATPEETNGFALLPADAPLPEPEPAYLRAMDLRHAVQRHLAETEPVKAAPPGNDPGGKARI